MSRWYAYPSKTPASTFQNRTCTSHPRPFLRNSHSHFKPFLRNSHSHLKAFSQIFDMIRCQRCCRSPPHEVNMPKGFVMYGQEIFKSCPPPPKKIKVLLIQRGFRRPIAGGRHHWPLGVDHGPKMRLRCAWKGPKMRMRFAQQGA